eukprot:scaffold124875_cov72-Phaeocystis_antarctica.AAC.2
MLRILHRRCGGHLRLRQAAVYSTFSGCRRGVGRVHQPAIQQYRQLIWALARCVAQHTELTVPDGGQRFKFTPRKCRGPLEGAVATDPLGVLGH